MKSFILLLVLMFAAYAEAQDAQSRSVAQSNAATRLFIDLCISSIGSSAKLSELADRYSLSQVDPPFSQKVLKGKSGEVWSASSSLGDFLVISQPDNSCSVWARRADAATSIQHFKRIIMGVQRPGLEVKVFADRDVNGQGGTYHFLAYLLSKEGQRNGTYASIEASASPDAEVQVRIRMMPAKDD